MIAAALFPLLPGRISQLQHRLGQPGVTRRQIRGAVLFLIQQGKARYFRGRVVPTNTEIAMTQESRTYFEGLRDNAAPGSADHELAVQHLAGTFPGPTPEEMDFAVQLDDARHAEAIADGMFPCCGAASPPCPDFPASCENPDNYPVFWVAPPDYIIDEQEALDNLQAAQVESCLDATLPAGALLQLVQRGAIDEQQAGDAYYNRFLPRIRRPLEDVAVDERVWGGRKPGGEA